MERARPRVGDAVTGARDVGGEGKVVFSQTGSGFRVGCDLPMPNRRVALALVRIIEAFKASVDRVDRK